MYINQQTGKVVLVNYDSLLGWVHTQTDLTWEEYTGEKTIKTEGDGSGSSEAKRSSNVRVTASSAEGEGVQDEVYGTISRSRDHYLRRGWKVKEHWLHVKRDEQWREEVQRHDDRRRR